MQSSDNEILELKKHRTQQQVADMLGISRGQVCRACERARKENNLKGRKGYKRKPETPVLNMSDLHSGKETESFNLNVLEDRLQVMKTNVLSILNILGKTYKFEEFVINMLGDVIDGDAIYKTHAHHTDKRAPAGRQQVKELNQILRPLFLDIQKETGLPLRINGVRGNHGRVSHFTQESNNFDLIFYDMLQESLSDNKKIDVRIAEGFADIIRVQGHGLLLYHGAGVRCYQSIPWYGLVQRTMRWKQSMKQDFIAAIMGHFHSLGHMRWIGTDIFLNGTCVTDDDFSMEHLGMDGEPSFWLFSCHPERGITWSYPISLME